MKLLYFCTNYPSYSETFVAEEISQLQAAGHQVTVCNFTWYTQAQDGRSETIINNSPNVIHLTAAILQAAAKRQSLLGQWETWKMILSCMWQRPSFLGKYVYLLYSLDYMCQKAANEEADLIVSHFLFKTTLASYLIGRFLNTKVHIRLHTKRSLYPDMVLQKVLNAAHTVTAESRDVAEYYEPWLAHDTPVKVIRQSVDFTKLQSIHMPNADPAHFNLIAIGRLVEKKGFHVLIKAIGKLRMTRCHNVTCTIYGDGPMREKLAQLIRDYDVSNCVQLAGRMKHGEVMKKLDQAHLLIVPSIELKEDIDGIPTVIAESMLLHTPVLTTPVGGISELITHGSTGFMVAPDNAEQLAIAITRLHDAAIRNSVVVQAYTKAVQEYQINLASAFEVEEWH